jgi:hypothetical protein
MVTQENNNSSFHSVVKYNMEVFWDDEYKHLKYINEPFNDPVSVNRWISQGYQSKITGDLCDMRQEQPSWNDRFIKHFEAQGWKDIGTAYYRMHTGAVMPVHSDLYKKYIELFNLQGKEHTIYRALILLEDWKSGHYLEAMGVPYTDWTAGTVVEWSYDTPHMAANIGLEPRYTLQITGHK